MQHKKTILVVSGVVLFTLVALFTIGTTFMQPQKIVNAQLQESSVRFDGWITATVDHINPDGTVTHTVFPMTHNNWTQAGANQIKTYFGATAPMTVNGSSYIAVGNTTPPAWGDTTLASEVTDCGLARVLGTYTSLADGNWSISNKWTVAGCAAGGVKINTTATFNASAAGTMLGGGNFTLVANTPTLFNDDNFTINYTRTTVFN